MKAVLLKMFFLLFFDLASANPKMYQQYKNEYPHWKFLSVVAEPLSSPSKDSKKSILRTWISYRTSPNFDPQKKSILFINGGPGGNSLAYKFENLIKDYNFIYFNQRGTGFSFPDRNLSRLHLESFFSSANTVEDIKALLTHLKVRRAVVYAHSYGTVVATMLAHKYPSHVEKMILEGTVFEGTSTVWNSPHRRKILQRYFNQLPLSTQNQILFYSQYEGLNPAWFSIMAHQSMYGEDFHEAMNQRLQNLFDPMMVEKTPESVHESILREIKMLYDEPLNEIEIDSPTSGSLVFKFITCLELSGKSPTSVFGFRFDGRTLIPQQISKKTCDDLDLSRENTYKAQSYPFSAPVVYIQGQYDGATTADLAIQHFKTVPQGPATFILAKNGGHSPLLGLLNPYLFENTDISQNAAQLFRQMVENQVINLSQMNQYRDRKNEWVMTSQ